MRSTCCNSSTSAVRQTEQKGKLIQTIVCPGLFRNAYKYIYLTRGPRQLCLNQSTANRTKSINISKCKKYIQTWCNFQGKRTAGAEIYLNWAIKGTSSFTPPNEIRKNHEAKMCIGLPREVKQI